MGLEWSEKRMKRKYLVFGVILLVVLVTTLIYLGYFQSRQKQLERLGERINSDPELAPFVSEMEDIKELNQKNPEAAEARAKELVSRLPEKYRRQLDLGFKAGMLPINFYGKIVDQNGLPVVRAKVIFETTGAFLAPGKGMGFVFTDDQGRYEIHSEGGKLKLAGIVHPFAVLYYPRTRSPGYSGPNKRFKMVYGGQPRQGANELLWKDTSPAKPHVFTAWRVDRYEDVFSGGMDGQMRPDGSVYTFDFDRKNRFGEVIPFAVEGEKGGHLHVTCSRPPIESIKDWQDWEVTFTVVDGGIQLTDDYYQNLAPETGYSPSLTIEQRRSASDYQSRMLGKRFYFTTNNSQVYGSLYATIEPHLKPEQCRVVVSYKINFNGSRNLAIKNN
jgi:hypothetical protein